MKRIPWLLATLLLAAIASPALAGGGEKCSADVQTCLNSFAAKKSHGWLGLKYDKAEDGSTVVTGTTAGSPAEQAGFQKGDVLVALNGASFADKEAIKKAKGDWKPGSKVTYTVKRAGAEQQIAVTLAAMPEEVFAQMVGEHMVSNHMAVKTAAAPEKTAEKKY